jgi:hypothetical protein
MQIYQVLKSDHNVLKGLLNQLVALKKNSTNKKELLEQIRLELVPHSRAEEAIFYNSLRAVNSGKEVIKHSYEEHIEAEAMLTALYMESEIDASWTKDAIQLKTSLEHHISEEEGRVFELAQRVFSAEEAEDFAVAFEAMKAEVKEQGFLGTTFDLFINLLPPRVANSINKNKFASSHHS